MPLMTSNGALIVNSSALATGTACCCGATPCASDYPGLNVTVTWSGGAATRTVFGTTWTNAQNGSTKTICPTTYVCSTYGNLKYETWLYSAATASRQIGLRGGQTTSTASPEAYMFVDFDTNGLDGYWLNAINTIFGGFTNSTITAGITSDNIVAASFTGSPNISTKQFGFVKGNDAGGGTTTIQWAKGPGAWGCH